MEVKLFCTVYNCNKRCETMTCFARQGCGYLILTWRGQVSFNSPTPTTRTRHPENLVPFLAVPPACYAGVKCTHVNSNSIPQTATATDVVMHTGYKSWRGRAAILSYIAPKEVQWLVLCFEAVRGSVDGVGPWQQKGNATKRCQRWPNAAPIS